VSGLSTGQRVDAVLTGDILAHLETQMASARRMLAVVLEQATAIRQRSVPNIVRLAGALQAEMHRREVIELERNRLMERAGVKLGIGAGDVSIKLLTSVMDDEAAVEVRARTTELRRMLSEIQHEHEVNRALMQQELSFLDHLLRLAGGPGGYSAAGERVTMRKRNLMLRQSVFELEA
jgi:hypothetical protein